MNTAQIIPLSNRLLIEMLPRESVSAGGIHFPEMAQVTAEWGKVLATGSEVEEIQEGELVYLAPRSGTHFILGGVDYLVVREHECLARIVA